MRKLMFALTLCLPASAQTWFTVIPATSQAPNLSVSLPSGATYRFVSTNGKATTSLTATAAPISDWDNGQNGNAPDPDPGFAKAFQVLESAAFSASVIDSSISPAKTTAVSVPALAPPPAPLPPLVGNYTCTVTFTAAWTFTVDPKSCVVKK